MKHEIFKYLIIGNSAAANAAVTKIRALDKNGAIRVFGEEPHPYYYRPRLPEVLSGEVALDGIAVRKADWYKINAVDVKTGVRVARLDPSAHTVETEGGESAAYEKLLLATGARPFLPSLFAAHRSSFFTFRTAGDALSLKKACAGKKKVIMVGGGLLALEVAAHLGKLGLQVTVIEVADRLLPRQLDADGGVFLQSILSSRGLVFHLDRTVSELYPNRNAVSVTLNDGSREEGDLLVVCTGIQANTDLARHAGLSVARGIVVDDGMRTSHPDIWAAGDCAEQGGRCVGLWPAALAQGTCAGARMAGTEEPCKKTANTAKIKIVGIDLVSSGTIDNPALQSVTCRKENVYRRLYLDHGRAAGVILFGDLTGEKEIISAVTDGRDLSGWGDSAIDPSFEWAKVL